MIGALLMLLAAGAGADPTALELAIWGGPPGAPTFHVSLSSEGHLNVQRRSLPITPDGLTKTDYATDLDVETTRRILDLAGHADDFTSHCTAAVADGTNAELTVRLNGRERRISCENADEWPKGPHTKALVQAINDQIPEPHRIH